MKQLKFEHTYATDIKNGVRTTTLRLDDKDIVVGDSVEIVDKVSSNKPQQWEIPGELFVVGVQTFLLSNLPMELVEHAEIASKDRQKLYEFLRRFYGEGINDSTIIKLITFNYKPYAEPRVFMEQKTVGSNIPKEVILYADGGSRGNPGPSAAGFVIHDSESNVVVHSWNKYLGITTNNQAEYHGLIAGLEWCAQHRIQSVIVRLDSLLVVNQMKGAYKVKNRDLWTLYETANTLKEGFKTISFTHVPRELNRLADAEVNKALDAVKGSDVVQ